MRLVGDHSLLSCSTTHWKQTLFMMDDPVPVHTGDVVTGSVVLQRNPVWRRHMSVSLSWVVTSALDPTSQRVRYFFVKIRSCRGRISGRPIWVAIKNGDRCVSAATFARAFPISLSFSHRTKVVIR